MAIHTSRRSKKNDWHVCQANGVWRVYDPDQKFRCGFRIRAEADAYIESHATKRQRRTTPAVVNPELFDAA